jgi:hypothetical protein
MDDEYSGGIDWGVVDIALPDSEPAQRILQENDTSQQTSRNNYNVGYHQHPQGQQLQLHQQPMQQQPMSQHQHLFGDKNSQTIQPESTLISTKEFYLQQQVTLPLIYSNDLL